MIKRTVPMLIDEAILLLKADRTSIVSSKDIVNQLAWLLFLKCLEISGSHQQRLERFTLQRVNGIWHYSWTSWVEEMLQLGAYHTAESRRFLCEQFHPKLGELFGLNSEYFQVHMNFTIFQDLLRLIDEITPVPRLDEGRFSYLFAPIDGIEPDTRLNENDATQIYSALYTLLTEEHKDLGILATPPAITHFMVQVLAPKSSDIVYDPACGTGDFLLATKHYCEQKNNAIAPTNLYGRDSAEQIIQLARMNMLLCDIASEQVQRQEVEQAQDEGMLNILDENLPDASVILTHPPLGRHPSRTRTPNSRRTGASFDCYEAWFLQHSWRKLSKDTSSARCGMVVSEVFLDGRDKSTIRMRKEFLQTWNILMIVWLPEIAFSPILSKKIFLLFFDSRPLAKKILHYNLALRLDHKKYTYAKPLQDTDFAEVQAAWELWKNHLDQPGKVPAPVQTEYQWIMTYDPQTFDQRSDHDPYTLLPLPPPKPQEKVQLTPDELLRQIEENHVQQLQHIQHLRELLSSEEGDQA